MAGEEVDRDAEVRLGTGELQRQLKGRWNGMSMVSCREQGCCTACGCASCCSRGWPMAAMPQNKASHLHGTVSVFLGMADRIGSFALCLHVPRVDQDTTAAIGLRRCAVLLDLLQVRKVSQKQALEHEE